MRQNERHPARLERHQAEWCERLGAANRCTKSQKLSRQRRMLMLNTLKMTLLLLNQHFPFKTHLYSILIFFFNLFIFVFKLIVIVYLFI